ncbi:hypothetical protein KFU94_33585 [Chloroflexi bacterium TSY]|nr:hypothetical protein [Chloroflexi bacterium TSY]
MTFEATRNANGERVPPRFASSVAEASRIWALIAYLLLIVGWLLVLLLRRNDPFARFHANQSLRLSIMLVAIPSIWALFTWLVLFVRFAGPLVSASSFGLLIIFGCAFVIAWITGILNALRGKRRALPFFGGSSR